MMAVTEWTPVTPKKAGSPKVDGEKRILGSPQVSIADIDLR
jgi:hypothetical protein